MSHCFILLVAQEWSRVAARCRQFLAYLFKPPERAPVELNQKGVDHLTSHLTALLGSALGSNVINDKDFQPALLSVYRNAVWLGSYLLRHPADHRYDWTTCFPSSEEPIVVFPTLLKTTDNRGLEFCSPALVSLGQVDCVGRHHSQPAYPDAFAWAPAARAEGGAR